ncbi:hypothetical protein BP6252_10224 [Coleophoma cylindrospora]|uniref:Cucumopine synthase C-terminal helical bundle domain-containing protein n=1 Tax=Coleophoma cylindrospora TaxID=1849047 RepID=A0A3D8QXS8_9HELO|nr:hypothetical protein BP6252_10224 [Coleophoma cylindrospora]
MQAPKILEFVGPTPGCSFRVEVFNEKNADLLKTLSLLLPLNGFLIHAVIAGETFYVPTPSLALAAKNMMPRRPGSVYYNVTGQSICFCYGLVTESTLVNEIGEVLEEDLPRLVQLGKLVYEKTCSVRSPNMVRLAIRRPGETATAALEIKHVQESALQFDGRWERAKEIMDQEVARLRVLEEPDEIQKIRLCATGSRAGQEATTLQPMVILYGYLATLGPHSLTRLLAVSKYKEVTLSLMVRMTRQFLVNTFNQFELLADVGLTKMRKIGIIYNTALDSVTTLENYRLLTDSLRSLVQILFRWIHLVFPWFLKDQLTPRTTEEASTLPKIQVYSENMDEF